MAESTNQSVSDGSVGVGSMTGSSNGIPEHLLVAVQSVNNPTLDNEPVDEKPQISNIPVSNSSLSHLCTVPPQQQAVFTQQAGNGIQANGNIVSATPQHGQGFVNVNGNQANIQPYPQLAAAGTGNQGYAQVNTLALGQSPQVMHAIMPPAQSDGNNVNNQSHPQINNVQNQQNQPYSMPQMILTAGQPIQGIQTAQLLIPTSSGMVSQQILTIPINQATNNQMIQMVAPNGQLFTSSVANLQAMSSVQQMVGTTVLPNQQQQIIQASPNNGAYPQPSSGVVQQLMTNSAGQVIAVGHPNLVQQTQPTVAVPGSTNNQVIATGINNQSASSNSSIQQHPHVQEQPSVNIPQHSCPTVIQPSAEKPCSTTTEFPSPSPSPLKISEIKSDICDSACSTPLPPCVSSTQHFQQEPLYGNGDASSTTSDTESVQNPPSPGAVNSLDGNIVDGINLEEIKDFAKAFKLRRLSLGLTQTQVGEALSAAEGPAYSQSAICRFEKLDITPKSALRIKPVLERWLREAEERYKSGHETLTEYITESSKKRKRRTSFTPQALDILNKYFKANSHPTGTEMTSLAISLNYDREVVRVWFCNKRQALKNTVKRLHTEPATI